MAKVFFTFTFDLSYFNGYEDHTKDEFRWFELEGDDKILSNIWGEEDEEYDDHFWKMEEYGVHDFGGAGGITDPVYTMGYSSYEVEPVNMDDVINGWRNHFASRGFNCSHIDVRKGDDCYVIEFNVLGF